MIYNVISNNNLLCFYHPCIECITHNKYLFLTYFSIYSSFIILIDILRMPAGERIQKSAITCWAAWSINGLRL